MTKLQIMIFLQTFISRFRYDYPRNVVDTFEFDVENVLKTFKTFKCASSGDYEDILNVLRRYSTADCSANTSIYSDFINYLRAVENICC